MADPLENTLSERDPGVEHLLSWLKETRGFDFTGYKRPSLVRRIARRMSDVGITDVTAYRDHLELHPDEFTALFNTVLINVTSFFRDQESWDHLTRELLPPLLARNRHVRAWSAGCASGQEAYTLAIVLAEALGIDEFRRRVKIYATDVDEEALAAARAASYTEAELAGLRPEQLERWFVRDGERWTVLAPLRRAVVFGRNDLVQDAPISHIDVLMCRNTLMYLNAETQARVVGRLHFALEPHGVLMLGKAEMLLAHSPLFTPIDLPRRLFRRRSEPVFEGFTSPTRVTAAADGLEVLNHEALRTAPTAQVVIDGEGRLALTNDQADRLFGTGPRDLGRPFQDLELSYRPLELRSHLDRALAEQRSQWVRGVELVRAGNDPVVLDVQVVPLVESDGSLLGATVVFDDVTRYHRLQDELEAANRKLAVAYEELQSTNEELETTNEELQSTVEELETTNEELQSTNEELETMNEELQSMNDQLHSGNDELREASELATGRRDMVSAVLAGMRAGVVVADDEGRLIAWNPASEELWGLREDEVLGLRLGDLDIGLPVVELTARLAAAHPDGEHRSTEVTAVNRRGRTVQVRATQSPVAAPVGELRGSVLVTELLD